MVRIKMTSQILFENSYKVNVSVMLDYPSDILQLAKDAASEVAMTDEEKMRVEDLLKDLEELPEIIEDEEQVYICLSV